MGNYFEKPLCQHPADVSSQLLLNVKSRQFNVATLCRNWHLVAFGAPHWVRVGRVAETEKPFILLQDTVPTK